MKIKCKFMNLSMNSIEAYQKLKKTGTLLDIRSMQEMLLHGIIDIKNTVFIEWSGDTNDFLSKTQLNIQNELECIFILCYKGIRSDHVTRLLFNNNFKNVINIVDGFYGWKKNNLPYKQMTNNQNQ